MSSSNNKLTVFFKGFGIVEKIETDLFESFHLNLYDFILKHDHDLTSKAIDVFDYNFSCEGVVIDKIECCQTYCDVITSTSDKIYNKIILSIMRKDQKLKHVGNSCELVLSKNNNQTKSDQLLKTIVKTYTSLSTIKQIKKKYLPFDSDARLVNSANPHRHHIQVIMLVIMEGLLETIKFYTGVHQEFYYDIDSYIRSYDKHYRRIGIYSRLPIEIKDFDIAVNGVLVKDIGFYKTWKGIIPVSPKYKPGQIIVSVTRSGERLYHRNTTVIVNNNYIVEKKILKKSGEPEKIEKITKSPKVSCSDDDDNDNGNGDYYDDAQEYIATQKLGFAISDDDKDDTEKNKNDKFSDTMNQLQQKVSNVENLLENVVLCPITLEPMSDPVINAAGQTYEKSEIEKWYKSNDTDPLSGQKVSNKNLQTNWSVKSLIQNFNSINKK